MLEEAASIRQLYNCSLSLFASIEQAYQFGRFRDKDGSFWVPAATSLSSAVPIHDFSSECGGTLRCSSSHEPSKRSGRSISEQEGNFFDTAVRRRLKQVTSRFEQHLLPKCAKWLTGLGSHRFLNRMPFDFQLL